MNVTFTGKIIAAEPLQQGTSQTGTQWASQNFVIEELNQQYPSRTVFQVFGSDKLQQFGIQVGEIVTAHLGLKARQSNKDGRWFNQIDCWKLERPSMQQQGTVQAPQGTVQGQVVQSAVGQQPQIANIQQQITAFPPQVNANGQAANQQTQYGGGQADQLPFAPM